MNTQDKINEVLEKLVELKKVEKHFQQTINQLDDSYQELDKLHDILEKEYIDVKELESLSMKSLFHRVLGSKEEQIEKERQEYLQATLKYNEFRKSVELLEFERDLLKKKITDVTIYESKLEQLKLKREKELIMSDTTLGKKLMRVVHMMDQITSERKELTEARQAGSDALHHIKVLITHLKKAKDWGSWDMMGNNSRHAAYYKRGAIDNAREASHHAKHHLNRFQKELYDMGERQYNFDINIGSYNSFSDIFFDNLISDWIIQQKIKNAMHNVDGVYDKIQRLLQSIDHKILSLTGEQKSLQATKDQIILEG